MKTSREINILLLVTFKADSGWSAVDFDDRVEGPALVHRGEDVVCEWNKQHLTDEAIFTLLQAFPEADHRFDDALNVPFFIKRVREVTAP